MISTLKDIKARISAIIDLNESNQAKQMLPAGEYAIGELVDLVDSKSYDRMQNETNDFGDADTPPGGVFSTKSGRKYAVLILGGDGPFETNQGKTTGEIMTMGCVPISMLKKQPKIWKKVVFSSEVSVDTSDNPLTIGDIEITVE